MQEMYILSIILSQQYPHELLQTGCQLFPVDPHITHCIGVIGANNSLQFINYFPPRVVGVFCTTLAPTRTTTVRIIQIKQEVSKSIGSIPSA